MALIEESCLLCNFSASERTACVDSVVDLKPWGRAQMSNSSKVGFHQLHPAGIYSALQMLGIETVKGLLILWEDSELSVAS